MGDRPRTELGDVHSCFGLVGVVGDGAATARCLAHGRPVSGVFEDGVKLAQRAGELGVVFVWDEPVWERWPEGAEPLEGTLTPIVRQREPMLTLRFQSDVLVRPEEWEPVISTEVLEELGVTKEEALRAYQSVATDLHVVIVPNSFREWAKEQLADEPWDDDRCFIVEVDGYAIYAIHPACGDLDAAWRERVMASQRQADDRAMAQDREHAHENAYARDRFVNPYTFVPFPDGELDRQAPPGHSSLGSDRFSGSIRVEWQTMSPLMIRTESTDGKDVSVFPRRENTPIIPGSTIKGAVRTLHETLVGGCLRVVDESYVPVFRENASAEHRRGWNLIYVETVDGDRPARIRICSDAVWVKLRDLAASSGVDQPVTGMRFTLQNPESAVRDGDRKRTEIGRDGTQAELTRADDGEWVLLLTDASARNPRKHPDYWAVLGRLTDREARLDADAWTEYLEKVEGSDDLRVEYQHSEVDEREPVEFDGKVVGYRFRAHKGLYAHEVLWARVDGGGQIRDLSRASLWRRLGDHAIVERIPPTMRPCTNIEQLCPTCRVFGATDDRGASSGDAADVNGYAGHVRFGDATAVHAEVVSFELAPMGEPQPSAGQFYLTIGDGEDDRVARQRTDRPAREWGAPQDGRKPRQLRGRKYYWHGISTNPAMKRHLKRSHQSSKMTGQVEVIDEGARFGVDIRFNNLAEAEVGGLLSAIKPDLLLQAAPIPWQEPGDGDRLQGNGRVLPRIGGGKPFGFGTVDVVSLEVSMDTAQSRYGTAEQPALGVHALVEAFKTSVDTASSGVTATWPALTNALTVGYVNPDRIWYPPARNWPDEGDELRNQDAREFDESYRFFSETTGEVFMKRDDRGRLVRDDDKSKWIHPLPDATAADQTLPISPKAGR